MGIDDGGSPGMVTLHQMAEASFGQAGASATSFVYLGALQCSAVNRRRTAVYRACAAGSHAAILSPAAPSLCHP